ncbi:MAG: hypothetical protein KC516_03825 [Nanoarchaeota archaeon]|nr:hypothetical protein [Nanoarchaeota archaeon]
MKAIKEMYYNLKLNSVSRKIKKAYSKALEEVGNKYFEGIKYHNKMKSLIIEKSSIEKKLEAIELK